MNNCKVEWEIFSLNWLDNFRKKMSKEKNIKNANPSQRKAAFWLLFITAIKAKKPATIPNPVNK